MDIESRTPGETITQKELQSLADVITELVLAKLSLALSTISKFPTPSNIGWDCTGTKFDCGEYGCTGTVGCKNEFDCHVKFTGYGYLP